MTCMKLHSISLHLQESMSEKQIKLEGSTLVLKKQNIIFNMKCIFNSQIFILKNNKINNKISKIIVSLSYIY